eukprot:GGOE01036407.1.p1 GENE.GGOE01036407.1~~GGOE01036407.1.p1  ORF type:complete len:174 (+),score=30.50 GGOE01036407.1:60-524(+)
MASYFPHGGVHEVVTPSNPEPPPPSISSGEPRRVPSPPPSQPLSQLEALKAWLQDMGHCRPARHLEDCASLGQLVDCLVQTAPAVLRSPDKRKELQELLKHLSRDPQMSWLFRPQANSKDLLIPAHAGDTASVVVVGGQRDQRWTVKLTSVEVL